MGERRFDFGISGDAASLARSLTSTPDILRERADKMERDEQDAREKVRLRKARREAALNALEDVAKNSDDDQARVDAAVALLNSGCC